MKHRFSTRVFGAMLAVIAAGAATFYFSIQTVASTLFENQVRRQAGRANAPGRGPNSTPAVDADVQAAFDSSLDEALLIGLAVSLLAAIILGLVLSGRILNPLTRIRAGVARFAAGRYDESIPEPPVVELAELAADLNTLGAALDESEARRARLVSDVVHEMRTPITTINGFVDGMLDGVFEPSEAVLASVREETTRLERLASDLSGLSSAEGAIMRLEREPVDLVGIVTGVADRLRPQYEAKGVELRVQPGAAIEMAADPQRLAQVFTNIIGNALLYTPAGGRVEVASATVDGSAVVTVADTGAGMGADDLAHVFERFYRGGRQDQAGGTGIGLTIARGIARAHGGDITVDSAGEGSGSTFAVRLPLG
ncbi:MAG: HAMP domain-containing histidine kinase [Acidimicrobiia bacterium]|nr:MAG: HAMP domain-containing histidine kinase [Acidimicrobiia bacterium]